MQTVGWVVYSRVESEREKESKTARTGCKARAALIEDALPSSPSLNRCLNVSFD